MLAVKRADPIIAAPPIANSGFSLVAKLNFEPLNKLREISANWASSEAYVIRSCSLLFFLLSDTSLIILRKGNGKVTNITLASFNPRYMFNFSEAVRVCEILNGVLATRQQIQAAWDEGFQQCRWVWTLVYVGGRTQWVWLTERLTDGCTQANRPTLGFCELWENTKSWLAWNVSHLLAIPHAIPQVIRQVLRTFWRGVPHFSIGLRPG